MQDRLIILPLGGIGDVTKNMFVYEFGQDILLVDCGLGFPDETMIGVDLLIPDVSYLLKKKNNIKGMVLTHAHEDHIGALPYILPELPPFPIFGSPLTAAFANQKLEEFGVTSHRVKAISFADPPAGGQAKISLGNFEISFIRVTHSVPDSANLIIKTPVGVVFHASDFKFDQTPADGKPSEIEKIKKVGEAGVLCLLCDSLRVEKEGHTPSEKDIEKNFEMEMQNCQGKFIVTTYSSNVSRLNQAIRVAKKFGRRICFIGRSLQNASEIALKLGYMENFADLEIGVKELKRYQDRQLLLLVAGSQGQGNSSLVRIASDEDKFVKIRKDDVVVFSADPIPGNEVAINSLIDTLAQKEAKVIYSAITDDLHVSGHGAKDDIAQMIKMTNPRFLIPVGGAFRHMVQFRKLAIDLGFRGQNVFLLENGQEIIFEQDKAWLGRKERTKNIYVDEITGDEIEGVVLRDRQKLASEGILIVLVNVDGRTGEIVGRMDFISRGFIEGTENLFRLLGQDIKKALGKHQGRRRNIPFIRNLLSEHIEKLIYKKTHRRPLVLPIVIEV